MNAMTEITALEKKIDRHIEQQDRYNDVVSKNLEKLTDAMTRLEVFQVEVNNLASDVRETKSSNEKLSDRITSLEKSFTTVDEIKPILSKVFTSLITSGLLVAASAVGYVVFSLKS